MNPAAPLRVLMTTDTVGGVWTYSLELCAALAPHHVSVALATMGAPLTRAQWASAKALANVQVFESSYRLEWMQEPWDDVARAGQWLLTLEGDLNPDLVHLNGYAHGALHFRAPVLVVGHSCVCSWWRAVRGGDAPTEWDRYRREVSAGLHAAQQVVAPSMCMLDALREHYGVPDGSVIYNSRDPMRFKPGAKEPLILAVGRLWDEAKNIGSLAGVAGKLPWPVYVAGDTKSPDGRAMSLDGVNYLGHLPPDELARWYGRASIYAFPARYEPFGLSVLEAALSGCALVLGDIPSLQEIWGDAAEYVPPNDMVALRTVIERLVADHTRRDHLAHLARARAETFTPARSADGYLTVYRNLLGAGAA